MIQTCRAALRFWPIALAMLACAPRALASDTYPAAVQAHLGTCPMRCTLCHLTLAGGPGNTNNFGKAIQATANLSIRQPESIPAAIDRMRMGPCLPSIIATMPLPDRCDSDGDGMGDIEELEAGRDPNVAGEGNICGGPVYGCGARVARGSADFDWLALLIAAATAVTLVIGARRARRRARLPRRAR